MPVTRVRVTGLITLQAHFFGVPSVYLYRVFTVLTKMGWSRVSRDGRLESERSRLDRCNRRSKRNGRDGKNGIGWVRTRVNSDMGERKRMVADRVGEKGRDCSSLTPVVHGNNH